MRAFPNSRCEFHFNDACRQSSGEMDHCAGGLLLFLHFEHPSASIFPFMSYNIPYSDDSLNRWTQ